MQGSLKTIWSLLLTRHYVSVMTMCEGTLRRCATLVVKTVVSKLSWQMKMSINPSHYILYSFIRLFSVENNGLAIALCKVLVMSVGMRQTCSNSRQEVCTILYH